MEENTGTPLDSLFNDQSEATDTETSEPVEHEVDKGAQATPPVAAQTEPDHVPRAALQDERRKRQEYERETQELRQKYTESQQQIAAAQQYFQQLQAQQQAQQTQQKQGINPNQFETYEAYLEALADAKADARVREAFQQFGQHQSAQQRQQQQQYQQYQQHQALIRQTSEDLAPMLTTGRERYADFDAVVGSEHVPISEPMMTIMMGLPSGHDVAYHLGKNPDEAARISRLAPSSQARELGKLAASIAAPVAPVIRPSIPKTLTQTRSAGGTFNKTWAGPTPLDEVVRRPK